MVKSSRKEFNMYEIENHFLTEIIFFLVFFHCGPWASNHFVCPHQFGVFWPLFREVSRPRRGIWRALVLWQTPNCKMCLSKFLRYLSKLANLFFQIAKVFVLIGHIYLYKLSTKKYFEEGAGLQRWRCDWSLAKIQSCSCICPNWQMNFSNLIQQRLVCRPRRPNWHFPQGCQKPSLSSEANLRPPTQKQTH